MIFLFLGVLVVCWGVVSPAYSADKSIDQQKIEMLCLITQAQCPANASKTNFKPISGRKNWFVATGPGGSSEINISDQLLGKLQKYVKDPEAGVQLRDICPSQSNALQKAWGNCLPEKPIVKKSAKPATEVTVAGPCPDVFNVRTGESANLNGGCQGFIPDDLGNAWRVNQ